MKAISYKKENKINYTQLDNNKANVMLFLNEKEITDINGNICYEYDFNEFETSKSKAYIEENAEKLIYYKAIEISQEERLQSLENAVQEIALMMLGEWYNGWIFSFKSNTR